MTTTLMPLRDGVIVRRITVNIDDVDAHEGEVVAVSPESEQAGLRREQRVLFRRGAGVDATVDDADFLLLSTRDVLAVIERKEDPAPQPTKRRGKKR